ncbi:hypothetical protein GOBAR_AA22192 [Gossypium barbadense]|uniref:SWIM-type domain-containing protein n=1 Tax=Gossypium barbadense TaxID=3634 RepID=A0A2P5X535_GOSBA|nr:hypothetical protein GOBAR_AA22192 [Gossypium barbadense]
MHVVREDNICIISDRSKGLLAAIRRSGVPWRSVYCIRHITFQIKYAARELEPQRFRQRFARLESQMSSLPTDLRTWLGSMENRQWTQSYDEGFQQAKQIEAGHMYVEDVRKAMAVNSQRAQTMNAELRCECGIFQTLRYSCAHVHAPCARANLNVEQFIDGIYTLECTLRIWGNEFPVMADVSNWEVPPLAFKMVPSRSLRRHPKVRPQSTRIRNDMDVRETGEPKLCTVCRTTRHNRSTCPHCVYVSGQSSHNAGLQDDK